MNCVSESMYNNVTTVRNPPTPVSTNASNLFEMSPESQRHIPPTSDTVQTKPFPIRGKFCSVFAEKAKLFFSF